MGKRHQEAEDCHQYNVLHKSKMPCDPNGSAESDKALEHCCSEKDNRMRNRRHHGLQDDGGRKNQKESEEKEGVEYANRNFAKGPRIKGDVE